MKPLILALLAFLASPPLPAQTDLTPEETEAIRRILELEEEVEALLRTLSPAARATLERLRRGEGWEAPTLHPPPHPAAVPTPGAEPPPPPPPTITAPPPLPPPRRGRCYALRPFDENRDGVIDASDRVWRFLYLWDDGNGNGVVEKRETKSAFARGVRKIEADLSSFEHKKEWSGNIDIAGGLVFDLDRRDQPVLVIEAEGYNRSRSREGGPELQNQQGEALAGTLPFQAGWRLVFPPPADGEDATVVILDCP